jgi:hypothetical protein
LIFAGVFLLIGVPVAAMVWLLDPLAASEEDGIVARQGWVILRPNAWPGRKFPLIDHIQGSPAELLAGRWLILLYHSGCPVCWEVIDCLPTLAATSRPDSVAVRIALIEVPTPTDSGPVATIRSAADFHGTLRQDVNWLVDTPVLIEVDNGVISSVKVGGGRKRP